MTLFLDQIMSLKTFHIIFIILSILFCFGFAFWAFSMYSQTNTSSYLKWAGVTAGVGIGLIVYLVSFCKKLLKERHSTLKVISGILSYFIYELSLNPSHSQACAVCFGAVDSPMTWGLNWGILSLLFILLAVLISFTIFFIKISHKQHLVR